jgi:hypothetical protein
LQGTENELIYDPTELFKKQKLELTQKEGRWIVYEPINQYSTDEFLFNIPPQGQTYLSLRDSRLQIQGKVVNEDGTNMDENEDGKVAFVNLPGTSLFSNIDISLDGNPLSDLSNSYAHYKAYLDTVMSYAPDSGLCHLAAAHFSMDTPGKFETFNDTNAGFADRANMTGASKTFTINTPLYSDFFQIEDFFHQELK